MITIANPIYDIVFKYLMEDERIARFFLSSLLREDIVKVEVRPHEYVNGQRDTLSVFRIDFGATVRDAGGHEQLVLIELQKTWLETETLRFRQYLGVQYQNPKNMADNEHAVRTVAVYLLGHRVGQIEEPVLYVRHKAYDSNDREVTHGLPDPFVDSLTHDSIIVQIPLVRWQAGRQGTGRPGGGRERLMRVLGIFDQSRKDTLTQQLLHIDDDAYTDSEMSHIVNRLLMAASNADVRQDMNVEDEYYSIIEKRDTEILMKTKELAEKAVQLAEKTIQLKEKDAQIEQQSAQLILSLKMLLESGMTLEAIASKWNIGIEKLKDMLTKLP